jgi:hypothetical protein
MMECVAAYHRAVTPNLSGLNLIEIKATVHFNNFTCDKFGLLRSQKARDAGNVVRFGQAA